MKAATFREDFIAIIARELLKGLEYLHGEGKLHRGMCKGEGRRAEKKKREREWAIEQVGDSWLWVYVLYVSFIHPAKTQKL